jgi:hypothetical protein
MVSKVSVQQDPFIAYIEQAGNFSSSKEAEVPLDQLSEDLLSHLELSESLCSELDRPNQLAEYIKTFNLDNYNLKTRNRLSKAITHLNTYSSEVSRICSVYSDIFTQSIPVVVEDQTKIIDDFKALKVAIEEKRDLSSLAAKAKQSYLRFREVIQKSKLALSEATQAGASLESELPCFRYLTSILINSPLEASLDRHSLDVLMGDLTKLFDDVKTKNLCDFAKKLIKCSPQVPPKEESLLKTCQYVAKKSMRSIACSLMWVDPEQSIQPYQGLNKFAQPSFFTKSTGPFGIFMGTASKTEGVITFIFPHSQADLSWGVKSSCNFNLFDKPKISSSRFFQTLIRLTLTVATGDMEVAACVEALTELEKLSVGEGAEKVCLFSATELAYIAELKHICLV